MSISLILGSKFRPRMSVFFLRKPKPYLALGRGLPLHGRRCCLRHRRPPDVHSFKKILRASSPHVPFISLDADNGHKRGTHDK